MNPWRACVLDSNLQVGYHSLGLHVFLPPEASPVDRKTVGERGVRPGFWLTIIAVIICLFFVLRGYWEWAVVAIIAAVVLSRLPYIRWR
jgi:hypothetical protein